MQYTTRNGNSYTIELSEEAPRLGDYTGYKFKVTKDDFELEPTIGISHTLKTAIGVENVNQLKDVITRLAELHIPMKLEQGTSIENYKHIFTTDNTPMSGSSIDFPSLERELQRFQQ